MLSEFDGGWAPRCLVLPIVAMAHVLDALALFSTGTLDCRTTRERSSRSRPESVISTSALFVQKRKLHVHASSRFTGHAHTSQPQAVHQERHHSARDSGAKDSLQPG